MANGLWKPSTINRRPSTIDHELPTAVASNPVKIGLASDSFGNLTALGRAVDTLLAAGAERIFFLGGRYADVDAILQAKRAGIAPGKPAAVARKKREAPAVGEGGDIAFLAAVEGALAPATKGGEEVEKLSHRFVRVASKGCPEYHAANAPKKVLEMVEGVICCLVHDKSELDRDDISNAGILIHGNSGHPALVQIGPRFFITPGHLRSPPPADKPPTFALLDLSAGQISLVIYDLDGKPGRTERATIGGRGKVSVK
jgi:hypothetical protein